MLNDRPTTVYLRAWQEMATFFATADEFAAWLEKHGAGQTEFVVGYYKRGSKRPSMTWAESVDAALCFGWIVLQRGGKMRETGLQASAHRRENKSRIYSYEQQKTAELECGDELRFRNAKAAWKFFEAQPRGYRQLVIWRIISAKRPETRERRLQVLIKASSEGRRLQ
jgi:uncharacterized protein YdeI (YjbR/CyaY-like superfamily)